MAALTITSASSIVMLSVASVFPTAQQLRGFGVDEAFDTEPTEAAEVQLGVDGFAAAGWVPRLVVQTFTLHAASPDFTIFEDWIAAQDLIEEVLYAAATITIPAIKRKYNFAQGALTRFPSLPNARKTLQQRQFTITWMPPSTGLPAVTSAPT
jgi:hypothetical protein